MRDGRDTPLASAENTVKHRMKRASLGCRALGPRFGPASIAAQLGRFCSRDPISYRGEFNLYEYVGDTPVIHVDPTGLQNPGQGFFPGPLPGQPYVPGIHRHNCRLRVFLHETNSPFRSVNGHVYRYQI